MVSDPLEALFDLVPFVRMLDHRPGDLRLRFRLSAIARIDRAALAALARTLPGILDTQASLLSRTLRIQYDPERIEADVWEDLLALGDRPEQKDALLKRLEAVVNRSGS